MSKFVYQPNDIVSVRLANGLIRRKVMIESSLVGFTDPETENVIITYTAIDGLQFTDDQILEEGIDLPEIPPMSYADICLKRAEKATPGPIIFKEDQQSNPALFWINKWYGKEEKIGVLYWPGHPIEETEQVEKWWQNLGELLSSARYDVPELARRLKKACNLLRALKCSHYNTEWLADELEKLPE
jgi:hypothetical protein